MAEESILLKQQDGPVCTLTLNRPDQYNALSEPLLHALIEALDTIAENKSVKVVMLAANGKAYCAGHDLKQMRANDNHEYQHRLFSLCSKMMQKLIGLPQPVIAKVQGAAVAAGCQLVATCDLAVAADHCQFAVSGIRLGLFCSTPAVALSRNVSRKHAMQMLLSGDSINADTAVEFGLINQSVSADELDQATQQLAQSITSKPARPIQLGKRMFYQQLDQDLSQAYAIATDAISNNMMMDEAREGIDAFIQKRTPRWND